MHYKIEYEKFIFTRIFFSSCNIGATCLVSATVDKEIDGTQRLQYARKLVRVNNVDLLGIGRVDMIVNYT